MSIANTHQISGIAPVDNSPKDAGKPECISDAFTPERQISLFGALIDRNPEPVLIAETHTADVRDGVVRYANAAFSSLVDVAPDEIAGSSLFRWLIHDIEFQYRLEFVDASDEKPYHYPARVLSKDGSCREVDAQIMCLDQPERSGKCWAITLKTSDEVNPRLQEIEHLHNNVSCILMHADVRRNGDGTLRWISWISNEQVARRMLPYNVPDGVSYCEYWFMQSPPEDQRKRDQTGRSALVTGQSGYSQEFRSLRPNGEVVWFSEEAHISQIGPMQWHIVSVCIDITQRKVAEAETRELITSARCFLTYAIVERTANGEFNWDFHIPNQESALRWLPIAIQPGQTFAEAWLAARCQEDWPRLHANSHRALNEGHSGYSQDFRVHRADGGLLWIWQDVQIEPLGPDRWRLVGVCTDITQRKEMEEALRQSEERSRTLLAKLPHRIALKDRDSRIIAANEQFAHDLGLNPVDLIGKSDAALFPPSIAKASRTLDLRVMKTRRSHTHEGSQTLNGQERVIRTTRTPVTDDDDNVTGVLNIVTDITEQRHTEATVKEILYSTRCFLWHAVVTPAPDGGYRWDFDNTYELAGPAWLPIDRQPGQDFFDSWSAAVFEEDKPEMYRRSHACFLSNETGYTQEYRCRRSDGGTMWISEDVQLESIGSGKWRAFGVCTDVTEKKLLELEREKLLVDALDRADRDPLTGLLNHRAFHKRLEDETDQAARRRGSFALAVVDLDNFKFFNDAYGHSVGDDVLRHVAAIMAGVCRDTDVIARFGGDEFAIIMPGVDSVEADSIKYRLKEGLEGSGFRPPGYDASVPLSLSLGIAVYPDDGAGKQVLLNKADERLYQDKNGAGLDETAERLRSKLIDSVEGFSMLDALVTAVDNKDRYTARHSHDVLTYCVQIAREMGLDDESEHTLQVASLLHDVGKIGVPNHILRKPGKLTDEEFEAIKRHPATGAVIVSAVPGLEHTLDCVRHHHERWDGRGYPAELAGREIPLLARVMAVADAFSAMTTDRPYRKGMSEAKAIAILRNGAGTQWDPVCVDAFVRARSGITAMAA